MVAFGGSRGKILDLGIWRLGYNSAYNRKAASKKAPIILPPDIYSQVQSLPQCPRAGLCDWWCLAEGWWCMLFAWGYRRAVNHPVFPVSHFLLGKSAAILGDSCCQVPKSPAKSHWESRPFSDSQVSRKLAPHKWPWAGPMWQSSAGLRTTDSARQWTLVWKLLNLELFITER